MADYLVIDVGGTKIKFALMGDDARVKEKGEKDSPDSLEEFWLVLDELVDSYRLRVSGLAFSLPGRVDVKEGVVYLGGSLTYLHEAPIRERMEKKFGLKTSLQNDGKAAALAEAWLGSLKDCQQALALVLGTGIGGGLILDGHLRQGFHDQAGELSFMLLNPAGVGFDKMSGSIGSAVSLVERINMAMGYRDVKDGRAAFQAILSVQSPAKQFFEDYCRYIAILILNSQAILDVEKVAIGGGISAQTIVIDEINHQYNRLLQSDPITAFNISRPEIVSAQFGNDANLYGALYQFLLDNKIERGEM